MGCNEQGEETCREREGQADAAPIHPQPSDHIITAGAGGQVLRAQGLPLHQHSPEGSGLPHKDDLSNMPIILEVSRFCYRWISTMSMQQQNADRNVERECVEGRPPCRG